MHPSSTSINIKHFPNIDIGNSNPNQNKILPEKKVNHKFPAYNIQFLLFCFYRTIYKLTQEKKIVARSIWSIISPVYTDGFIHMQAMENSRFIGTFTYKKYANLFRLKLMIHMKVKQKKGKNLPSYSPNNNTWKLEIDRSNNINIFHSVIFFFIVILLRYFQPLSDTRYEQNP